MNTILTTRMCIMQKFLTKIASIFYYHLLDFYASVELNAYVWNYYFKNEFTSNLYKMLVVGWKGTSFFRIKSWTKKIIENGWRGLFYLFWSTKPFRTVLKPNLRRTGYATTFTAFSLILDNCYSLMLLSLWKYAQETFVCIVTSTPIVKGIPSLISE